MTGYHVVAPWGWPTPERRHPCGGPGVEARGAGERLWHAVVCHAGGEPLVLAQAMAWRDRELSFHVGPRRPLLAHPGRAHGEAVEVEVEARQVLRRPSGDRGHAGPHVRRRVVRDLEVVVLDVVPAVAVEREVLVAQARRSRLDDRPPAAATLGRRAAPAQSNATRTTSRRGMIASPPGGWRTKRLNRPARR